MRRALLVVPVVAVLVAGCGDDPSGEERLAARLREEFGQSEEQAACIADRAYDTLTDEELELLEERDEDDELSPELRRKLEAAVTPCASAGS